MKKITLFTFLLVINSCSHNLSHTPKGKIKNIILLIGDGMGPQQLGLLHTYAHNAPHSIYLKKRRKNGEHITRKTGFESFLDHSSSELGLATQNPYDAIVIDSACSANHLATGEPSGLQMIGLNYLGEKVETILEKAKKMGKSTGLVSDTRLTHATPAAFASHQAHRSMENAIAKEMVTSSNVDIMLSGGLRHFIPKDVNEKSSLMRKSVQKLINNPDLKIKSKRLDNLNLLKIAQSLGYDLAFSKDQLKKARKNKILGLFSYSGMPNGIVHKATKNNRKRNIPSLKEMTEKALDTLSKNPKGFFLMVEAGQIDWAGHNNDAGLLLNEMIKFDETIQYVYEWVKKRKDTLVVLTADHETGSFGFSYSRKNLPKPKILHSKAFKNIPYQPTWNFGELKHLDNLYDQKKAHWDMLVEYWDKKSNNPMDLIKIVNRNSHYKIDLSEAMEVLETEPNENIIPGHKYLSVKTFPKLKGHLKYFYVYGEEVFINNLGLIMSKKNNTVWGTGTHTNTPVPVIAFGPKDIIQPFGKLNRNTKIGKLMIKALNQ